MGAVRTDGLDVSFGEIISMYSEGELIIAPEYQRLFRWSDGQQSRLIESILLELPIPAIFVIENTDGVLELIDGLQRVSSILRFIEPTALRAEDDSPQANQLRESGPLQLTGCDLLDELNGIQYRDLDLRHRLRLKRSTVRMVMIRRQSDPLLRYAMFKRLNTGGALLSPQEIRNCTSRMVRKPGQDFYQFLQECAQLPDYAAAIESLSDADRNQKGDEELVLRFFAVKNALDMFHGSVRAWLDEYMDAILRERVAFDYPSEQQDFARLFQFINEKLGANAFVRYRDRKPIGALAPAYFEAVTMGVFQVRDRLIAERVSAARIQRAIAATVEGQDFRSVTGPAANTRPKLKDRIALIENALRGLVHEPVG